MRKTLILIALSVPLLLIGYTEGKRVADLQATPLPQLGSAPATLAQELKTAGEKAGEVEQIPDDIWVAALQIRPEKLETRPGASRVEADLTDAIARHAQSLEDARRFFKAFASVDATRDDQIPEAYRGAWADLRENLDREQKILALQKTYPQHRTDLRNLLTAYRHSSACNLRLYESILADIDWKDLQAERPKEQVELWYQELAQWTPGRPGALPSGAREIGDGVSALDRFLIDHPDTAPFSDWAKDERSLRRKATELVKILDTKGKPAKILDQLRQIGELVRVDPGPRLFTETAHTLASRLCDVYLPVENLDRYVVIQRDSSKERVERSSIVIKRKSKDAPERFDPTYDEYQFPSDAEDLLVGDSNYFNLKEIKNLSLVGTPYSDAVHAYNNERKAVRSWNLATLTSLYKTCKEQAHWDALQESASPLPDRVEKLTEVIRQYPELFEESGG
jgi:hypothetical protein